MGVVYRAEDPTIGRTVAIKTIHLGELTDSSEKEFMRERLLREARSAGMLSHPGIVTIYDISEEGDTAYVFMEFVNGVTLEKLIGGEKALDREKLFDVLRQTAVALDYAHGKGIVHRDIKPANIMISVDGEAKITDFGVAKILSQAMTQTRSVLGTPYYMSPEQIQGSKIDGRSDQFALAVIAYELMTGERPYAADSLPTLLFKIVKETAAPPDRVNPSLAPEVGGVLQRAFSKEPGERFETCERFVNTLAMAASKKPGWQPLAHGGARDIATVVAPPEAAPPASEAVDPSRLMPVAGDVDQAAAAPTAALPQIPRARSRNYFETAEEESHLVRNVMVAVFLAVLAAGGFYAYRNYFLGAAPAEVSSAAPLEETDPLGGGPGASPPPAPPSESGSASSEASGAAQTDQEASTRTPPPPAETDAPEPAPASAPESAAPPEVSRPAPAPPKPSPNQEYWVQIRSVPRGAEVSVDNDAELTCTTPCELPLRAGRHVLEFTMAGHSLAPRIIQVPGVTDVTATLDRQAGTLAITSTPAGAAIYINGEKRDELTPAMIKLPAGEYRVRLTLPGRRDHEDTVVLKNQAIMRVGIDW